MVAHQSNIVPRARKHIASLGLFRVELMFHQLLTHYSRLVIGLWAMARRIAIALNTYTSGHFPHAENPPWLLKNNNTRRPLNRSRFIYIVVLVHVVNMCRT